MRHYTTAERLEIVRWYRQHRRHATITCAHFGISRSTLYRWIARYDPKRPEASLAPQPIARTPRWTEEDLRTVAELAARHPRWGRGRLRAATAAEGTELSESTVGRMLRVILESCPICGGTDGAHDPGRHLTATRPTEV